MSTKRQSSLGSPRPATIKAHPKLNSTQVDNILDREKSLDIFSSVAYRDSHIVLVGAGGPGGFIALGLMRKGVKRLTIYDGDTVDITNLNRQRFFPRDIGKYKASQLAKNIKGEATADSVILGVDLFIEETIMDGHIEKPGIVICAPDNDETREFCTRYCMDNSIPGIIVGLSPDSDYGYVFTQGVGQNTACFGCLRKGNKGAQKCSASANINLSMVAAGHALSACDIVLSMSPIEWNYRRFSIFGSLPDIIKVVPKWESCKLCRG
ncbi:MAG: ThiF family adenylyltransferase [Candidatus Zixiibacteriota bacterium]